MKPDFRFIIAMVVVLGVEAFIEAKYPKAATPYVIIILLAVLTVYRNEFFADLQKALNGGS